MPTPSVPTTKRRLRSWSSSTTKAPRSYKRLVAPRHRNSTHLSSTLPATISPLRARRKESFVQTVIPIMTGQRSSTSLALQSDSWPNTPSWTLVVAHNLCPMKTTKASFIGAMVKGAWPSTHAPFTLQMDRSALALHHTLPSTPSPSSSPHF